MEPRWSVACGCARAKHADALGRGVGLRRCAAWGSAQRSTKLRKGHNIVPRRGAACSCAGASQAAGLRRSVGLRSTPCGRARNATWGCAAARCGTAQGHGMRLRRGGARSRAGAWRGVAPGVRGVAQGTPCGATKGHGMGLRWAERRTVQGRGMRLRGGRSTGPRRGVACGCAWAQRGAGLGGSVGTSKGEA